ncbi:MAG: hydroxyectoine utilization dehydratase EutB [Alphaproteobacteria bacterium]|nr:hydroxyectoine utilization dehydratase EutB [Alphaproteobacteria bacterium]
MASITIADIEAADAKLTGRLRQTPVELSSTLSKSAGVPVTLKLEHHQITGSFKLRGATNAVLNLGEAQKAAGVVGVSTGNHGRGLAHAAREAGVRCIICMSELVPQNKVDGIKAQGAEVRTIGRSQDDAQQEVDRLVSEEAMTMLPPFDHPHIIAGQGTLGLEILDQVPSAETILVPLSGGGLISGLAAAAKARKPGIKIIGVSMERGAAMHECLKAGKPIHVEEMKTLADSLGGGIGLDNQYTFPMTRDLVDDTVTVSEAQIAGAIRHAYWEERQIIEGSGSVAIAAVLAGKAAVSGPAVCVVSGANIDLGLHYRIISGEDVDVTKPES